MKNESTNDPVNESVGHDRSSSVIHNGEPAAETEPDEFNPDALRLTQDFSTAVGVKKLITVVPCRKPNRHEFIRVRAGDEWRLETGLFEDKIHREVYLVERSLWSELVGDVYPAALFLTITRQGNVFLWPCKLPGPDGRSNAWNESALAAAREAETKWVRVSANMPAGMYDVLAAADELSEPEWPDLSFRDVLRFAFKDRFIRTADHPVLKALRGEV